LSVPRLRLRLLAAFDVVFLVATFLAFESVIEV